MSYQKLMERIGRGERVLIDGATGTEVERRGVPQLDNAWNGGGTLSHPEIVLDIHQDYIDCGAKIIISNTFRSGFQCKSLVSKPKAVNLTFNASILS